MAWAERRFSHSLVLTGPLYIIHMNGIASIYDQMCDIANAEPDTARVLAFRHAPIFPPTPARTGFRAVLSEADCNAFMEGQCIPGMNWTARPFAIARVLPSQYDG
jgi:hypothetical protein